MLSDRTTRPHWTRRLGTLLVALPSVGALSLSACTEGDVEDAADETEDAVD